MAICGMPCDSSLLVILHIVLSSHALKCKFSMTFTLLRSETTHSESIGYLCNMIDKKFRGKMQAFNEADEGTLKKMLGTSQLPSWINFPDFERVGWYAV